MYVPALLLLLCTVQVAPQLPYLGCESLDLQSDQHANTPWPWRHLHVEMCDVHMLTKLPEPTSDGEQRSVIASRVVQVPNAREVSIPSCEIIPVAQLHTWSLSGLVWEMHHTRSMRAV